MPIIRKKLSAASAPISQRPTPFADTKVDALRDVFLEARNGSDRLPSEVIRNISRFLTREPETLLALTQMNAATTSDLHSENRFAQLSLDIDQALTRQPLSMAQFERLLAYALEEIRVPHLAAMAVFRILTEVHFSDDTRESGCLKRVIASPVLTMKGKAQAIAIFAQKDNAMRVHPNAFNEILQFLDALPERYRSMETLADTLTCIERSDYHAGALVGLLALAAAQPPAFRRLALDAILQRIPALPVENRASPLYQAARFIGYFDEIWPTSRCIRDAVRQHVPKEQWGKPLTLLRKEARRWSGYDAAHAE